MVPRYEFSFGAKTTTVKSSMKNGPDSVSTAKFGNISIQILGNWVPEEEEYLNKFGWREGLLCCCLKYCELCLFFKLFTSLGIMEDLIRCTPAPMSKTHVAVYITLVVCPYDGQSIYFEFVVSAISLTCERNSIVSGKKTTHLRDFFVMSTSAPILRKRSDPRKSVLTVFEGYSSGGATYMFRTTCGALLPVGRLMKKLLYCGYSFRDPPAQDFWIGAFIVFFRGKDSREFWSDDEDPPRARLWKRLLLIAYGRFGRSWYCPSDDFCMS